MKKAKSIWIGGFLGFIFGFLTFYLVELNISFRFLPKSCELILGWILFFPSILFKHTLPVPLSFDVGIGPLLVLIQLTYWSLVGLVIGYIIMRLRKIK